MDVNIGKALTWNDLANEYDKLHGGRKARTLPMDVVAKWAEGRTDIFFVDQKEGTFHKILTSNKKGKS